MNKLTEKQLTRKDVEAARDAMNKERERTRKIDRAIRLACKAAKDDYGDASAIEFLFELRKPMVEAEEKAEDAYTLVRKAVEGDDDE